MLTHRFEELVRDSWQDATASVPFGCAFVPCTMVAVVAPAQLAQIQAIYAIAAELTRVQLQTPRRLMPAFSRN